MLFFCEVFWFLILRIEMSMANLKKQQQTRERPTQGRRRGGGGAFIYNRNGRFLTRGDLFVWAWWVIRLIIRVR